MVAEAKQTGDWSKAKALTGKITKAIMPTIAMGDMNEFQMHNIALEKGRMDVAGWLKAGPHRPPHHVVPDRIKEFGRLGGEAWAALQKEYAKETK